MNKQTVLEISRLSFTYGCHTVLDDINLNIDSGEVVCITGPNGAGKTTLLKLLLSQLKPASGTIKLFGVDSARFEERYRIGYLSQRATHFNTQFPATAREVVVSGRTPKVGLFKPLLKEDFIKADQALEMVGMTEFANELVGNLSGGQQQRVLLARTLVCEPDLLILDEPGTGVDRGALDAVYQLLKTLNRQQGTTMLIVTHELEGIASIMTRQVCLDKRICTCACHQYTSPEAQIKHCGRRMMVQLSESQTKEPCYGNLSL